MIYLHKLQNTLYFNPVISLTGTWIVYRSCAFVSAVLNCRNLNYREEKKKKSGVQQCLPGSVELEYLISTMYIFYLNLCVIWTWGKEMCGQAGQMFILHLSFREAFLMIWFPDLHCLFMTRFHKRKCMWNIWLLMIKSAIKNVMCLPGLQCDPLLIWTESTHTLHLFYTNMNG